MSDELNVADFDRDEAVAEAIDGLDSAGATRGGLFRRAGMAAGGLGVAAAIVPGLFGGTANAREGGSKKNDVKILNFALTLEYLEAAFYAAADQAKYADADIAAAAKTLASHEAAHVAALKKVLGSAAVKPPTVNLDTVGKLLADQNTFIKTAAAIEPVGTAAYAGAGPYINNLAIVRAALSIHSVEAQHAAYTASIVKFKGIDASADPVPNAFNPAFSFAKTIKTVTALNVVKGDLQP